MLLLMFFLHTFLPQKVLEQTLFRPSVRLSVRYFSAGIATRDLKFFRWCVRLNSMVRDLGSVA
jgi:hypothetical protein